MDLSISSAQIFNGKLVKGAVINKRAGRGIVSDKKLPSPNDTQSQAGCIGWALLILLAVGSIAIGAYTEIKDRIKNKNAQNIEVPVSKQYTINN